MYTITRATNTAGAITVNLTWSGTAAASRYKVTATGGMLNAAATQLIMPDGGGSATITLTPVADNTLEAPQTAILTLGSGTGYAVGSPSAATVTLYDTTNPTVSIGPATMTVAGSSKNQTLTFTVSLSGSSPNTAGVTVKTANGTAVAGTDFTALSSTHSFAAGTTSQTVTVTLTGRKTGSVTKSFTVVLSSPTNATLGTTTSTVTITGTSAQLAAGDAPAGSTAAPLTMSELTPVLAAAEDEWASAGIPAARLAAVQFVITTLPQGEIGYTVGDTVYIDPTAAGFGWYAGPGNAFGADGGAITDGPAVGHMDLLTVVLHELGHTVGLSDGCACGPYSDLMQTMLAPGVRRVLPTGDNAGVSGGDTLSPVVGPASSNSLLVPISAGHSGPHRTVSTLLLGQPIISSRHPGGRRRVSAGPV